MRQYIKFLFIIAAGAFAAACTPEQPTDKEILDSRTPVKLEFDCTVNGAQVNGLTFTHDATLQEVKVNVNNENLSWNLESNRNWCTVVEGTHKGSGSVTLEIATNESFDDREQATLTFVAGEYRKVAFTVDQTATAFIIGQPYFVSPKAGGPVTVKVTTRDETVWSYDGGSWIAVAEDSSTSSDGFTTTTLTLTPAANEDNSRYGSVELTAGAEKDYIYVYQFGTELPYDDAGNIFFTSGVSPSITLTAPAFVVSSVEVPVYATGNVTENGDGTATITIDVTPNLSDVGDARTISTSLKLSNASATVVTIPDFLQDFTPAHGIVTGKGLQAFASAVAEGASTATWEQDGVVCVLNDIDMSEITGWTGIGTADKPFTGVFNGGNHSVTNLKNTAYGLFGYCKDATVQDITLGKGSSIYNNKNYAANGGFGGIVSVAENTTVSGCGLTGSLEFGGTSDDDYPAYVGGIVGLADEKSVIKGARMDGTVVVSAPAADDIVCYAGGVAGLCKGSLNTSEVLGNVTLSSSVGTALIGGVQGALIKDATVSNNTFTGKISLSGNCKNPVVGGLYGRVESDRSFDNDTDKSVTLGTINLNSFYNNSATCVYAGGFVGLAASGIDLSFKGYEAQSNIVLDAASAAMTAQYICIGGYLGGCAQAGPAKSLTFENLQSSGTIETQFATGVACTVRRLWVGGMVGYANGPSTFSNCINKGEIGKSDGVYCARSNGYGAIVGGIAGYAGGGDASFDKCSNQGEIANHHYNNNGVTGEWSGMYTPCVAAGILGAFNYGKTVEEKNLTISSCSNAKSIFSYRGYTGGIVGYCINATITSCTNEGRLANGTNDQNAYRGGMAGGVGNATVNGCSAKCDVTALVYGSADYGCAGGIVGLAKGDKDVLIEGCSYFGTVKSDKKSTDKPEYPGGILGMGTEKSTVKDCKFGGNVQGVEINENNVSTKVIGNGVGTVEGISYWNGN